MAGHSKFKNIMHRKGAQDKKRAKLFTKLIREIIVATKISSPDPQMNPRLRIAILAARNANLPKSKIELAIQKASSPASASENYEEIRYEGYSHNGVAFIVETLTDNRNRTASEVRSAFTKTGGVLGDTGSVAYLFERIGLLVYTKENAISNFLEVAIECGANDYSEEDDSYFVVCDPSDLSSMKEKLDNVLGVEASEAKLIYKPTNLLDLDEKGLESLEKLITSLEENDDVQNIWVNVKLPKDDLE